MKKKDRCGVHTFLTYRHCPLRNPPFPFLIFAIYLIVEMVLVCTQFAEISGVKLNYKSLKFHGRRAIFSKDRLLFLLGQHYVVAFI